MGELRFLTDRFESIRLDARVARRFGTLGADYVAKAVWYRGRPPTARDTARAMASDGSFAMALYRLAQTADRFRLAPLAHALTKLNTLVNGCVIGRGARFGAGFVLVHTAGIVINGGVVGGENVIVEHGVTIGAEKGRSPRIGDNVFIGAGAKIVGGIRVGDHARIGANAVVVKDVPDHATVVGVPAYVVRVRGTNGVAIAERASA